MWVGGMQFDFGNFPETFRGYFYPFVIMVSRMIGDLLFNLEWLGFLVCNCLIIATIISWAIPEILHVNRDSKKFFGGSIFFTTMINFFGLVCWYYR